MSAEEVRAIARRYLHNVKSAGPDGIAATCPFHQIGDRVTTTLSMSLTRGVWFCFSCHERGNLQVFLKKMGVSYREMERTFQFLLDELDKSRPPPPDPLRTRVLSDNPLPESILGVFDMCPLKLLEDGFTEETLQKFDVGFDMTNMRITYPLRDLHGKLVGISGRTIYDDVVPRYKIYDREYPTWGVPARTKEDAKRGGLLWNAHDVYPEIFFGNKPKVCLVEGFKACMWVVQAGFRNTVALIGSFLTWEHQWILERMGAEVYVFLDNNSAGWKGRDYIGKTLSKTLTVRIVEYADDEVQQPDGMDTTAVLNALDGAQEYNRWSMEEKKEGSRWRLEKTETY